MTLAEVFEVVENEFVGSFAEIFVKAENFMATGKHLSQVFCAFGNVLSVCELTCKDGIVALVHLTTCDVRQSSRLANHSSLCVANSCGWAIP